MSYIKQVFERGLEQIKLMFPCTITIIVRSTKTSSFIQFLRENSKYLNQFSKHEKSSRLTSPLCPKFSFNVDSVTYSILLWLNGKRKIQNISENSKDPMLLSELERPIGRIDKKPSTKRLKTLTNATRYFSRAHYISNSKELQTIDLKLQIYISSR